MNTQTARNLRLLAVAAVVVLAALGAWLGSGTPPVAASRPAAASAPPQATPGAVLGDEVRAALLTGATRPAFDTLDSIKAEHKPDLLRLYAGAKDLIQRRGLVWALGLLGGADVSALLARALSDEFQDRDLSDAEEDVLGEAVRALGLVAEQDDAAYRFVREGCDVKTWKKRRAWRSARGDYGDSLMVSFSIQAVAVSGRPDAAAFLDSLKQRSPAYLHAFAGDVTQGLFYLSLRQKGGKPLLMQCLLTPEDKRPFMDWIETDEGRSSLEWANEKMRGPSPGEPAP
jgi:hypothetical protein